MTEFIFQDVVLVGFKGADQSGFSSGDVQNAPAFFVRICLHGKQWGVNGHAHPGPVGFDWGNEEVFPVALWRPGGRELSIDGPGGH